MMNYYTKVSARSETWLKKWSSGNVGSPHVTDSKWNIFSRLSSLIVLFLLTTNLSFGQIVTIGSGTATSSGSAAIPVSNYVYNYNQQIITAAEINAGGVSTGNITKIRYKATNVGTVSVWNNWTVYIGNTTKTSFASTTDWVPLGSLTEVFSGIITPVANEWFDVTFTSPFAYTGGNLVIAVDENTLNWTTAPTFQSYTSAANTGIYYRSDSTNPNPASPPTATGRVSLVAQIQLVFPSATVPNCAISHFPAASATNVVRNPTLTWAEGGGGPTSYDVYFGTSTNPSLVANVATTSYSPGLLNANSTYYWKVIPKNSNGDATGCVERSFTTGVDYQYCAVSTTYTSDYTSSFSTTLANANVTYSASSQPSGSYSNQTSQNFEAFQGQTINFSHSYVGGSNGVKIWIDLNKNGVFDTTEEVYYLANTSATKTGSVTVPLSTPLGSYRVRVRSQYGSTAVPPACGEVFYGSTLDFTLNVVAPPACSGSANTGTAAISSANGCSGGSVTLSATGLSLNQGYDIQWQSSTDGTNWTNIGTENGTGFNVASTSTGVTYYKVVSTCSASSTTVESNVVSFTGVSCGTANVPSSGNSTVECGTSTYLYSNGGPTGSYIAYSNGYTVLDNSGTGVINLSGSFSYIETNYDYLRIYSGAGTGGTLLATYSNSSGGTIAPITSLPGQPLTVQFTSDVSGQGLGFALQVVYTGTCLTCETPIGGTATAAVNEFCISGSTTISATGYTTGTGSRYQWESSDDNFATAGVPIGTVSSSYANLSTGTLTASKWYRLKMFCNAAPTVVSYSTVAPVIIKFPGTITSITPNTVSCPGISTTLSVTSTDNPTFAWTAPGGYTASGSSISVTPSSDTTYTVTATYPNGCTTQSTTTVSLAPAVVINSVTSSVETLCGSGTVTLNATFPEAGGPATYCSLAATSTCCEKIANVVLGSINNPSSDTGGYEDFTAIVTPITAGVAVPFTIDIASAYQTDDIVFIAVDLNKNGSFTDSGELLYTGLISDFCPTCSSTDTTISGSITVPVSALNGLTRMRIQLQGSGSSAPQVTCGTFTYGQVEDYTVSISGGVGGLTYAWTQSPAGSSLTNTSTVPTTANVTQTTTYTLTATSSLGCSASSSVTVNVNPLPTFNVAPITICEGDTGTLTATTSENNSYSWTPVGGGDTLSGSSVNVSPTETTTYNVTATSNTTTPACQSVEQVTVTVNDLGVIVSGTTSRTVSPGQPTTFEVETTGSNLSYQWQLNDGNGWADLSDNSDYSGVNTTVLNVQNIDFSFDQYQYRCLVTGLAPCNTLAPIEAVLNVSTTGFSLQPANVSLCGSSVASFSIQTSGDDPFWVQWQMSNDGGVSFNDIYDGLDGSGLIFSGTDQYTLNVSGIDVSHDDFRFKCQLNFFLDSDIATLNVNTPPSITNDLSTAPHQVCKVTTNTVLTIATSGSVESVQWKYATSAGGTYTDVADNTPAGVTYSGENSNSLTVTTTAATAVGNYFYKAFVTGAGFGPNKCSDLESSVATISLTDPQVSIVSSATAYCTPGAAVNLTASGASTYSWSTGETSSNISVAPSAATTYTVTGTDAFGCSNTATQAISVGSAFTLASTANVSICEGNSITLNATPTLPGGPTYLLNDVPYSFQAVSSTFTPLVGGTGAPSITATSDDSLSGLIPLGFNFTYGGNNYTGVRVNSNGLLMFGSGSSSSGNSFTTTTAALRNSIAPLWDDLQCSSGITYQVSGTAPNRVLTVEWLNMEWNWSSNQLAVSFQVKLYETTNAIELVYRNEAPAGASKTASVGLLGNSGSYISLQDVSSSPVISTTSANNSISDKPATGQIYRFTPAPVVTYTYAWSSTPSGFSASTQSTSDTPADTTTYNVVATSNSGCSASASSVITVIPTPIVTSTNDGQPSATRCGIGSVNLTATASAGNTLNWYTTATGGTPLYTGGTFETPELSANTSFYVEAATPVPAMPVMTYCSSTGTGTSYYINNFTTTNGTKNISNTNTGLSANGYGDYTSLVAGDTAGGSVNFTVNPPSSTYGIAIWIDWNNDGDFDDAGEQVYASNAYVSSASGTINVPASATSGTYRMRVKADFLSTTPPSCGTSTTSETEDYSFEVSGCVSDSRTQVNVIVNPAPALSISSASNTICSGDSTSPLTITSPLSNFDTYDWSPATGVTGSAASGYTFNPTETTTYTLTAVKDDCVNKVTYTVNVNALPDAFALSPAVASKCVDSPAQNISVGVFYNNPVPSPTACLQAGNGQYPSGSFTPATCNGTTSNSITTAAWAGEYSLVNTTSNTLYTFTSSGAGDYVTISNAAGTVVYAYGLSPLTWYNSSETQVRFYTQISSCSTQNTSRTRSVICKSSDAAVFSPVAGLYTNASATIPYTGGAVANVYAKPNTTTTYTATVTNANGCFRTASSTINVNPLPTASIAGTAAVCNNSTSPLVTFTGAAGTAPYTFTYSLTDLTNNTTTSQTVTTTSGNSVSVPAPTNVVGTYIYELLSVQDSSSTTCSQSQSGFASITVNPLPTATIAGTTEVCQNEGTPVVTFTGANGTAPYTFSYTLNGVSNTITSTGDTATISVSSAVAGTFEYSLVSVQDSSSSTCSQAQAGTATIIVHPTPMVTTALPNQVYYSGFATAAIPLAGTPSGVTFNITGGSASGLADATGVLEIPSFIPTATPSTVTITPIANGCVGVSKSYQIAFNPVIVNILSNHCGSVNNGLNNQIQANSVSVPGYTTTGYRFEITNMATGEVAYVDTVQSHFKLTDTDIYAYGTTYSIRAAAYLDGQLQGYFGTSCNLTTASVTTTKVINSQCGATLAAVTSSINANSVNQTNLYRFRVALASAPTTYYLVERTVPNFNLTMVPGLPILFETEYKVDVQIRVKLAGFEAWSQFGQVCSIFTPAAPTTSVILSQCEMVATSDTQVINATPFAGATSYRFLLTGYDNETGEVNYSQYVDNASASFTLSQFTGLTPNTTYIVSVAMSFYGSWTPYGKDCTVTTPGLARIAATPFSAVAYPNPFAENFKLDVKSSNSGQIDIKVYDMVGRLVEQRTAQFNEMESVTIGDNYPSGVYNVIVSQNEDVKTVRVIKR